MALLLQSTSAHKRLSACRRYAFTINNYKNVDYVEVTVQFCRRYNPIFMVVGREIGNLLTGTPHLQGFVHLRERVIITQLRKMLSPKGHFEMAKGSDRVNFEYCKKKRTRIPLYTDI